MKYRKLRIAWSVAWGVVAVLLCVLWVRSYWNIDGIRGPFTHSHSFAVSSERGGIDVSESTDPPDGWKGYSYDVKVEFELLKPSDYILGFAAYDVSVMDMGRFRGIVLPHWFLLSLSLLLIVAPWRLSLFRFSLRTLLIATTLVAVVLGLVVWASR